jgi:uncharacterized protein
VKIDITQIPPEGLTLAEEFNPQELELETEIIKFCGPVKAKAEISKIANAVTVYLTLHASIYTSCSRCLDEFESEFKKNIELNYPINPGSIGSSGVNKGELVIDPAPEIREEIILDYPFKPLCRPDCKGLCPKCGKNLNEGGCKCVS